MWAVATFRPYQQLELCGCGRLIREHVDQFHDGNAFAVVLARCLGLIILIIVSSYELS